MQVAELLAIAGNGAVDPSTCMELLRQAELREIADARTFLLELKNWNVCDPAVVWTLRQTYNAAHPHDDQLWVPLTADFCRRR